MGVTNTLRELLLVRIPLTKPVCLLGLVEDLVQKRAQRTSLSITLFYARKSVVLYWKKPDAPSLAFWKGMVNKSIPFDKATYAAQGCQKKSDGVAWVAGRFIHCWLRFSMEHSTT